MQTVILILFIIVCLLLISAILLQPGKDGGMGAISGSASGGSVFGSRGAVPFLAKVTVYLGITFTVLVLIMARLGADSSRAGGGTPVVPAAPAPAAGAEAPTTGGSAPTTGGTAPAPAAAPAAPAPAAAPAAPADAPAAPAAAPAAPAPAPAPGE